MAGFGVGRWAWAKSIPTLLSRNTRGTKGLGGPQGNSHIKGIVALQLPDGTVEDSGKASAEHDLYPSSPLEQGGGKGGVEDGERIEPNGNGGAHHYLLSGGGSWDGQTLLTPSGSGNLTNVELMNHIGEPS